MKEANKFEFSPNKGMEHFTTKKIKQTFDSIVRTNYDVDVSSLDNTCFILCTDLKALKRSAYERQSIVFTFCYFITCLLP